MSPAPAQWSIVVVAVQIAVIAVVRAHPLAVVVALAIVIGAAAGGARLAAIERPSRSLTFGARLQADAVLLERPRPAGRQQVAALRIVGPRGRGARVLARADVGQRWARGLGPGAVIAVRGELRRPRSSRHARFDYPGYLRRRGIFAELELDAVRDTGRRRRGVAGVLDRLRGRAEEALITGLSEDRAALARGMVLGQDDAIAPLVLDDFRRSGLAHVLAVSGQNVSLLGALALPIFMVIGLGRSGRLIGVLALIAVYVPLAGAGPSLQRAGVTGAAGVVALALSRPASRWYGLLLAGAITLVLNPLAAGDPGWQLSFAAVASILFAGPDLRRLLGALPHVVRDAVVVSVAATAGTMPLLAYHFGTIALVSLPANLLALPVVAPIIWIGVLEAALGQLAALPGPIAAGAGEVVGALGAVNDVLLGCLSGLAELFSFAPGAGFELALGSLPALVLAYGLVGAAALALREVARTHAPRAGSIAAEWRRLPARRRRLIVSAAVAIAVLVCWRATAPASSPDRLTVSFLDVGQGDATLVQATDGEAILFDGGPPEAGVARLLRSAGVSRLSAVIATHQSRDHHGGLAGVFDRIPVDLLLDGGDGTADPGFRTMVARAGRHGVRRVVASAGQTLRVGSITVRILAPPPRRPGPAPADPNPRAVAAVVSVGRFDLFLAGDAESAALTGLALPDVEALKVSHHGSSDPGLASLLRRLRPQVAAIEVGAGNRYGHPAPDTVAALRSTVPHVYRTDRDGTVTLTVDGEALAVRTER